MVKIEGMKQEELDKEKTKEPGRKKNKRSNKWRKRWLVMGVFGVVMVVFIGSWLWGKIGEWWEAYKAMNTVVGRKHY